MKRLTLYFSFLATIMIGSLCSCQDDDQGYTYDEIKASVYQREFAAAFGKPDPNHTWGFIDQPILNYAESETRTVNTESNLWGDPNYYGLNVPADITPAEAKYVYNWFATNQNPQGVAIHWSDFFIQYVSAYNEVNNTSKRNMDQLGYESIDDQKYATEIWWPTHEIVYSGWEHVNDFNVTTHTTKYVYDAGTENWTYRASHSDTYQSDKYTIQFLSFTASDGKHYEGWYVGFDYESVKYEGDGSLESNSEFADGYYNDWIVKVTPGTHQGYPITVRVMCEDLGNSFDWDFNDVVFDVSFVYVASDRKYRATIVLQAVGGTLPIYVGTTDERYEAHKLLGDGSMTPIIHPSAPAIYTIEFNESDLAGANNVLNAKIIPIYVEGVDVAATDLSETNTPQRFACPDYVQWSEELVNICDTYQNFPQWVKNDQLFSDVKKLWEYNPKAK